MRQLLIIAAAGVVLLTSACAQNETSAKMQSPMVIEIATFELADGVSPETFDAVDRAVELEHVAKQPGFIKREAGYTEDGEWLAVVYWESSADAEASMQSFASAPAAADFMSKMDPATMAMKRYTKRP